MNSVLVMVWVWPTTTTKQEAVTIVIAVVSHDAAYYPCGNQGTAAKRCRQQQDQDQAFHVW